MAFLQMDNNPKRKLDTPKDYETYCKSTFHHAEEYFSLSVGAMRYIFPDAVTAITTNIAFACELYLKCILFYENREVKGHYLDCLFNEIQSKDIKAHIKTFVADDNFELELKEVGKAFEITRYMNEYSSMACNMRFLAVFMDSLRKECRELLGVVDNA